MVLADLQAPLNIPTLSGTLGVSDRYLRNVFQSVDGLSTLKYVKLSRARRALMSARSPTVTVTNVAIRHGFREMGRFSVEYREMFGESPSVTLRQAIREHKRRQRLDG
jgi:transcriptional regulator GlxA family with amidase domain